MKKTIRLDWNNFYKWVDLKTQNYFYRRKNTA